MNKTACAVFLVVVLSCGGDPGPKGDTGAQGPAGPQGPQGPGLANQAVQVDATGKVLPASNTYVDANGVAWGYAAQGALDWRPYPLAWVSPIYTGTTCSGPVVGYFYGDISNLPWAQWTDWTRTSLQVTDASQNGVTLITTAKATAQMKAFPSGTAYSAWSNGPRACNIANAGLSGPGGPAVYGTIIGFAAGEVVQIQRPDPQVTPPLHWEVRGQ